MLREKKWIGYGKVISLLGIAGSYLRDDLIAAN